MKPKPVAWYKLALLALGPVTILAMLLEAGSSVYYRWKIVDDFMPIDVSNSFQNIPNLFERRQAAGGDILFSPYFPTRYYSSDRSMRGKSMAAVKSQTTFRVFSFGGSSTAGSPWGHEASFSRFLEDELNALKREGTNVEVLNFGGSGYGSTRALGLVKATIDYAPDLIVIYSGHNEMWDNYIYLDLAKDTMAVRFQHFGERFYTVKVARKFFEQTLAKPPERVNLLSENSMYVPPLLKDNKGFKAQERRYFAAQFEQNMRGIIATAQAKGVPVLLVSQPSHFYFQPSWFPAAGQAAEAGLVEEMRAAHAQRNWGLARGRAEEILRQDPENALAHFHLGLLDQIAGAPGAAREHFLAAIDYDERPERYVRAYREIQQRLADPGRGVYFVDFWQAAADHLDDGLQDGRLFVDKMHPILECNKLICATIERDYFARYRVRSDLFDYGRLDPDRVWQTRLEPEHYLKICSRYFKVEDPAQCVPEMFQRYTALTEGTAEKGIQRISWEYLMYYALLTGDRAWLDRAESVYPGRSLQALRAEGGDGAKRRAASMVH
ncbi:MAG TPA: SGNH/GDSL hydrolase family protein [Lacunisphaera sp.]|nr:SGNH/GDSL hydrolase family protein [Lacunisphaera sp.]